MGNTEEEARIWAEAPGVTHVASQPHYDHPGKPFVPFTKLNDRKTARRQ
jgi:hypothetical protein